MAGRHFSGDSPKKGLKKSAIIAVSVIGIVIIISVVILILLYNNGDFSLPFETQTETTQQLQTTALVTDAQEITTESSEQTTSESEETTASQSSLQDDESSDLSSDNKTTDETSISEDSSGSESVVVPGDSDNATYFSATLTPYKVVDSDTGEECSFKEVFGSSYSGGSIEFNSDGSFKDTLTTSSSDSGEYAVKDNKLIATYSNDKNMDVSVNSWDGSTPTDIVVNYGGYNVYLN